MSHSMNFPIQKNNTYNISSDNPMMNSMGKSNSFERDNIYAQYKPALSKDNSMSREYPPSNLQLVTEPKKLDFDIMMK
ncbi:MAG: hypothetical protein MJ252_05530 [archaeon]|nr:hypothetical protein [archaeon]